MTKISSKFFVFIGYPVCCRRFSSIFFFNFFRDNEKRAEIIAAEIESQANYKERIELENGDEETRFAAVERPSSTNNSTHGAKGKRTHFILNSIVTSSDSHFHFR